MTHEIEFREGRFGLSENGKDLLSRFFSILLTALISALITFLQSMLADPSLAPVGVSPVEQAGATGAILRTLVLVWKERGIM